MNQFRDGKISVQCGRVNLAFRTTSGCMNFWTLANTSWNMPFFSDKTGFSHSRGGISFGHIFYPHEAERREHTLSYIVNG
jgi:hypothetical protein